MPRYRRVKAQNLTAMEKGKYFISLYVRAGAVEEKISYCEKRAALEPGEGAKILKRKAVQEEIDRRMEPVRLEQMRQHVLGEAVAQAKAAMQEDLIKKGATIKEMNIAPDVLEGQLMQIVVGLDWDKHPKVMLDAIKAALVVTGTLEIKSTGWLSLRASPHDTMTRMPRVRSPTGETARDC
jgi:hypothetical protein